MSEENKIKNIIKETADDRLSTYGDYLKWTDEKREVYLLNEDKMYGKPAVYLEEDKVPVIIFSDFEIELSYVFRE